MTKQEKFVLKWIPTLEKIQNDDSLKERCIAFNVYMPSDDDNSLLEELKFHCFMEEAYESGIVVSNYAKFTEDKEEIVSNPDDGFIDTLSKEEIMSCIAWNFRRDHFVEGSLINESFVDGSLLSLFKFFIKKQHL